MTTKVNDLKYPLLLCRNEYCPAGKYCAAFSPSEGKFRGVTSLQEKSKQNLLKTRHSTVRLKKMIHINIQKIFVAEDFRNVVTHTHAHELQHRN
ncbi:hypothetical protein T4E_48 [Trichinella pseudospiralis]|uniref:Uncharacterized protein n=1 Tax=Trichinella pseudospiralis TaxID=6337 RepID=A0A0V0XRW8_TRIPS|nr:hypothetical protein T4E_48 [Trichinella pseudospiralis]